MGRRWDAYLIKWRFRPLALPRLVEPSRPDDDRTVTEYNLSRCIGVKNAFFYASKQTYRNFTAK